MYPLLDTITTPSKLRALERKMLSQLADELRQFLVESVAKTGGHLSSNLGTVELTIALPLINVPAAVHPAASTDSIAVTQSHVCGPREMPRAAIVLLPSQPQWLRVQLTRSQNFQGGKI